LADAPQPIYVHRQNHHPYRRHVVRYHASLMKSPSCAVSPTPHVNVNPIPSLTQLHIFTFLRLGGNYRKRVLYRFGRIAVRLIPETGRASSLPVQYIPLPGQTEYELDQ